ncbi:UNVERIFIED_CONTAM: hypothetical protein Sradi_3831300 [Sesamum radiatum]|uniref:Retrotransposon gag protein n=1 Tax=Sesamum radiatum TaxID=300843 RepID=A0AAW2Q127_SESRA
MERSSSSRIALPPHVERETTNITDPGSYDSIHKMEFPLFNGEDARASIRRCTRYFLMIPILENQKVPLTLVHIQGRAELWYQGHVEKRGEPNCQELIVHVLETFEDLDYERVVTEFN